MEKAIVVAGMVKLAQQEKAVKVKLDTGADVNVINPRLVEELGLDRAPYQEPRMRWGSGTTAICHGAYEVPVCMTDSDGRTETIVTVFYSLEQDEVDLLLGMPGLKEGGIQVDAKRRHWRFDGEEPTIRMISAKEAEEDTDDYYEILLIESTKPEPADDANTLPKELSDLGHLFNTEAAVSLPQPRSTDHAIETTGEPPHYPIYNLSVKELEVLKKYLVDAQANGWIRPSISPGGAPVLFVPKKNGDLRLCVDYRGLNKLTVKNRYPLPLISEILDRLSGMKIFTKLDLKNAYHRIRIKHGDEWKTAFRTRYGHFEYLVMPFGLANAPATFQSYINQALGEYVDTICIVYLDDILIFSKDHESHVRDVRAVLARLKAYDLFCNQEKCTFFTEEVEFLGFIVGRNGVRMDESRVETIKEWPRPQSFKDIQTFIGFCNFYRRFIEGFSRIARAMNELLKGSQNGKKAGPFEWSDDAEHAFRNLREAFTRAPIMRHFDLERPIKVETDASGFAIAGILSQLYEDSQWHPVAFFSRKLKDVELRYETFDQELLAIVDSFKHWRHYLEGSVVPIQVYTDHRNLMGLARVTQLNGRQARWAMLLAGYDFVIHHREGKSNPADAPSRRPDYERDSTPVDGLLPTLRQKLAVLPQEVAVGAISAWEQRILRITRMKEVQHDEDERFTAAIRSLNDSWTQDAREMKSEDELGAAFSNLTLRSAAVEALASEHAYSEESFPEILQRVQAVDPQAIRKRAAIKLNKSEAQDWTVNNQGLLCHHEKVYVPNDQAVQQELLRRYHDDPLAGHFAATRTQELLQRRYFWPRLATDVEDYVASCDICQRIKVKRHKPYGELQALPHPQKPWQEITMDFMSGIPPSKRNGCVYDAILVIVDRYTKMSLYIAVTKTLTAVDLAEILVERVISRFGVPKGIVSDRDTKFTSEFWSELCHRLKIKRRLSTAFHPQTDGQTERQNQTIQEYLRAYCGSQQNSWTSMLALAEFAYNNSKHSTTGISPFFALYGFHPEIYFDVEDDIKEERVPAARAKATQLQSTREELERRWQQASLSQAKYYNKKHKPLHFNKGDLVLMSTKNLKLKLPSKKIAPRFIGPFRVLEPIGTQAYRLQFPSTFRIYDVVHISLLEKYVRRDSDDQSVLPLPELVDDNEEWEIEEIKDRKKRRGKIWYLIRWKGYPEEYNQWVPEEDMGNAKALRDEYDQGTKRQRGRPAQAKQDHA